MKIADRCFTGAIVLPALFLLCSCATDRDQVEGRRAPEEQSTGLVNEYNNHQAEGGNPMNANLMMLDARINAANGHYKTVLITIADKQINSRITTSKSELEQLNSDLAQLYKDRRATEEQITGLANEYNTALKNH
jgi:septal ring factor EnvC (AmiA/AmiB activator)